MSGQDHYQVLGVPHDADLSQIRAAYVCLLKRLHPDQAGANNTPENGPQIQRIIGAYRILKDPAARARYDNALKGAARPALPPRSAPPHAREVQRTRRRFKLDPDIISYVVMIAIAAVGLHLLISRLIKEPPPASKVAEPSSVRAMAAHTQFEAVIRNAGMMSAREARIYSARCFAAARRSKCPGAADPCVGFDLAYIYWRETMGGPIVVDSYFQPNVMSSRARHAFRGLSPSRAAARVQSIRSATLRAIMQMPSPADDFAASFGGSEMARLTTPAAQETAGASPQGD